MSVTADGVREGYMKKLGGALSSTWQQRYVSVTRDGILRYYKTSEKKQLKGSISCTPEPYHVRKTFHKKRQCLELRSGKRKYYFAVDSADTAQAWLDRLKVHSEGRDIDAFLAQASNNSATLGETQLEEITFSLPTDGKNRATTTAVVATTAAEATAAATDLANTYEDGTSSSDEGMDIAADAKPEDLVLANTTSTTGDAEQQLDDANRLEEEDSFDVFTPLNSTTRVPKSASRMPRKSLSWFFSKEEQSQKLNEPVKTGSMQYYDFENATWLSGYFKLMPSGVFECLASATAATPVKMIILTNSQVIAEPHKTYSKDGVITLVPGEAKLSSSDHSAIWAICAGDVKSQKVWIDALCSCVKFKTIVDPTAVISRVESDSIKEGFLCRLTDDESAWTWVKLYVILSKDRILSGYMEATANACSNTDPRALHLRESCAVELLPEEAYYREGTFAVTDKFGNRSIFSAENTVTEWVETLLG